MSAIYKDCAEPHITLTCNDIFCTKGGQGTETQEQALEFSPIGHGGWLRVTLQAAMMQMAIAVCPFAAPFLD